MCLTYDAMLVFLTFLSPEIVEFSNDSITIHAEVHTAIWQRVGEDYCMDGPRIDIALRNAVRPAD